MAGRILIVDDQPGIRMLLTDVLADQGYEVITAQTGTEALEKIRMENFHLIILDYQLPLLSGKEILHKLEEEQFEIPAILMSGLVENIKRKEINYQYLKEVLGKPFSIHKVIELVAQIVSD